MKEENKTERHGKQNGYSNRVRLSKLNKRRSEAVSRQNKYNSLSVKEKIALAQSRRGESKKELVKLNK
jgi:hypothetical protein